MGDLKSTIWTLTNVVPPQQRLVGLVAGSLTTNNSATIDSLALDRNKQPKSFSLAVLPPTSTPAVAAVAAAAALARPKLSPQLQYVSDAVEGALKRAIQDVRNVRKVSQLPKGLFVDA